MKTNTKFNLTKINMDMFNSEEDTETLLSEPENEEEILEKCRQYEQVDYPIKVRKVEDLTGVYWIAEHPDLPGCVTDGATKLEAINNLEDAKKGWIYTKVCEEEPIPQPDSIRELEECSGKVLVRLPKEIHYRLIQKAKHDGTSLNQEIVYLLSMAFGESKGFDNVQKVVDELKQTLEELLPVKKRSTDDVLEDYPDFIDLLNQNKPNRTSKTFDADSIGLDQPFAVAKKNRTITKAALKTIWGH